MPLPPDPSQDPAGARFGIRGEYSTPFIEMEQARYQFIQAVRRLCPRPLEQLRDYIFPLYSQCVDARLAKQSPMAAMPKEERVSLFKRLELSDAAAEIAAVGRPDMGAEDPVFDTFMVLESREPELAGSLMVWAQQNGLAHRRECEEATPLEADDGTELEFSEITSHKEYWACEWALHTLWDWKFSPRGAQRMHTEPPEWVRPGEDQSIATDEPAFRVRPGWDVLTETEPAFRDRAERDLTAYIERSMQLAEAHGFVVTSEKPPRHFDWLALYQVEGWNYAQIAEWDQSGERSKGEDTIRKGVCSAAGLCKLNRRPGVVGRPKQSGTNKSSPVS